MATILVAGEPIQWHLPQTTYDRCPDCGAWLGCLSQKRRACMGTCMNGARVITLVATPVTWLMSIGFDALEARYLANAKTAGASHKQARDSFRAGRYEYNGRQYIVRPGFLTLRNEDARA